MGGEVSYTKTIVEDCPEFLDKPLLLVDSKRERLFRTEEGKYIEVVGSNDGKLAVNEVDQNIRKTSVENMSLRGIGIKFLGFSDPSVPQMLQHLVTPEMEVERIFNNMRYKYLKAIYLAGFENPYEYISPEYNKAFQALAGKTVYQGNTSDRKENDDFYRDIGFTDNIKDELKLNTEGDEMVFILHYIRYSEQTDYARIYAELIAIKPGFHELMVHSDYFDESSYPAPDGARSQVFRLLRGIDGVSDLELDGLPHDINTKSYFTYGSCNVTEGPFVYRKRIDTSYYEEIRKIRSKPDTGELNNSFHVLTYHNTYLFSWNNLIENDSESKRLLQYLVDYHDIGWTNRAEIHKSDDGKTIRIYTNENSVELTIDDDCGKATLKIDDGRTCDLKVENDHGILYISWIDKDEIRSESPPEQRKDVQRVFVDSDIRFTSVYALLIRSFALLCNGLDHPPQFCPTLFNFFWSSRKMPKTDVCMTKTFQIPTSTSEQQPLTPTNRTKPP